MVKPSTSIDFVISNLRKLKTGANWGSRFYLRPFWHFGFPNILKSKYQLFADCDNR